ncbi:MAG: ABC transporter permease [Anaerolineae bacterium]
MMTEMVKLGARELLARKRVSLGLILGVSVALLVFLALEGITAGVGQTLTAQDTGTMMVLPEDTMGFWGSYLPMNLRKRLKGLGASMAVPEIFVTRERAPGEMLLFRGVPLNRYQDIIGFQMVAGEPLAPGDRHMVMLGADVAESKGLGPGDIFEYRGKKFTVKGVFKTGLLADSEVWLDLKEADRLFNAQGYVSTFVLESDPALARKIEQRLDLDVVTEKEVWESFNSAAESLFALLRLVSVIIAAAAVLGIMNMMFTVVKQRQREIAIMRSIGFGRGEILIYVISQSLIVSTLGFFLALAASLLFIQGLKMEVMGMTLEPALDTSVVAGAFVLTLVIGLLAGGYPATLATRLNIAETLRGE